MKLKSFYESYDLMDMEIIKLYSKDDKIYLLLNCATHLDLMGNGIRPEFNVSFHHMFIFNNDNYKINLRKNIIVEEYSYDNDVITLKASGHLLKLSSDPEVIENYV